MPYSFEEDKSIPVVAREMFDHKNFSVAVGHTAVGRMIVGNRLGMRSKAEVHLRMSAAAVTHYVVCHK